MSVRLRALRSVGSDDQLPSGDSCNDNRHESVSSFECDGTESSAEESKRDSGLSKSLVDGELFLALEQKIDKLSEILQEQHDLLMGIKENVISSKAKSDRQRTASTMYTPEGSKNEMALTPNETAKAKATCDNGGGRCLLDGTDDKQDMSLDQIIGIALENFLQSDRVREHVASTTAECVKNVVHGSLCRVVTAAYLPAVERSHRRLVKHVTKLLDDSFNDLEEGAASLFKTIHKTSRNIRLSLEKHQNLLEATDPAMNMKLLHTTLKRVLEEELRVWRGKVLQELTSHALRDSSGDSEPDPTYEYNDYSPISPMQPGNPDTSVIDTLMRCAIINKRVQDGDIDKAFEEALGAADLSLVVAACRAAQPAPAAAALRPAARLALVQQLATDMVHDTQLKCRYLEETILTLDNCDSPTREHLPLVVRDVRKHLTEFLHSYPKHHASRRIALIVMAANNLLK